MQAIATARGQVTLHPLGKILFTSTGGELARVEGAALVPVPTLCVEADGTPGPPPLFVAKLVGIWPEVAWAELATGWTGPMTPTPVSVVTRWSPAAGGWMREPSLSHLFRWPRTPIAERPGGELVWTDGGDRPMPVLRRGWPGGPPVGAQIAGTHVFTDALEPDLSRSFFHFAPGALVAESAELPLPRGDADHALFAAWDDASVCAVGHGRTTGPFAARGLPGAWSRIAQPPGRPLSLTVDGRGDPWIVIDAAPRLARFANGRWEPVALPGTAPAGCTLLLGTADDGAVWVVASAAVGSVLYRFVARAG